MCRVRLVVLLQARALGHEAQERRCFSSDAHGRKKLLAAGDLKTRKVVLVRGGYLDLEKRLGSSC